MPSKSRLIHLVPTALFVLALLPGLPTAAFAEEPSASPEAETAAEEAEAPGKTGTERVYLMNGATITWDLEQKRFRPPTAEQAANLAEQFRAWAEARLADEGAALPFTKEIVVEELPDGMKKARLPIQMLNAAMVRIGAEGELAGMCSEDTAGIARTLATPAPKSGEVWQ